MVLGPRITALFRLIPFRQRPAISSSGCRSVLKAGAPYAEGVRVRRPGLFSPGRFFAGLVLTFGSCVAVEPIPPTRAPGGSPISGRDAIRKDQRRSMRWLRGEFLAQGMCVVECLDIVGLLLKNFVEFPERFRIIPRFSQCHGQVKTGLG